MKKSNEDLREKCVLVSKNEINGLPTYVYKPIWQIAILVLEENFQRSPRIWLQEGPEFKLRPIKG